MGGIRGHSLTYNERELTYNHLSDKLPETDTHTLRYFFYVEALRVIETAWS